MMHTVMSLRSHSRTVTAGVLFGLLVAGSYIRGADSDTVSLPRADAARLALGEATYRTTFTIDDEERAVSTRRAISRVRDGDDAIVRVREVSEGTPSGETTTDLAGETLQPRKTVARQGVGSAEMIYHADRVTGLITFGDRKFPVNVELSGPVFGEGAALETAIAALPLADGYTTTLRSVETGLLQRVRRWALIVVGREKIAVPAGTFAAFRVELKPIDDIDDGKTLWVTESSPRLVVQVQNRIESKLGGNVTTARLITRP
jgi:hypothetical protein